MHCVHTYRTGRLTISWRWVVVAVILCAWENENLFFCLLQQAISDFHLLLYLFRMDMLPMKSAMSPLLNAVRTRDNTLASEWKKQEVWTTLETLITASSVQSGWVGHIQKVPRVTELNFLILYSAAAVAIRVKRVRLALVLKLGLAIIAPLSMAEIWIFVKCVDCLCKC